MYKMSGPASQPTQLPIKRLPDALYLQVKRLGIEVNHSTPSSSEFKYDWSCTSALLKYPHGVAGDNFVCLLTVSFRLSCVYFSCFLYPVLVPFLLLSFPLIT